MANYDVSIVIVTWNSESVISHCLASIKKNPPKCSYQVWVVDNNSSDNTIDLIRKKFPWVKLIANSVNLGFARGNNQAFKKINSKWVLILNPDTEMIDGSLDMLIDFLEKNDNYGAAGPLLLNPDKTIQRSGYYRRLPSIGQVLLFYTELQKMALKSAWLVNKYWELDVSLKEEKLLVDQIPGACMLVRTSLLQEVNFFDEDYPLWFEDVDLSFKITNLGYKLALIPKSKVIHIGGDSFSKWQDAVAKQTRFFKSLFLYFDKNFIFPTALFARLIIISNLTFLILSRFLRQLVAPTLDRKVFLKNKMGVLKCLLV